MSAKNKNKHAVYDIIIIGAGPAGISCAIEGKRNGLSCLIIEKGVLTNTIYRFPTNMTFFSTSVKLEIGDVPFISHNEKPTRMEALEYYRRVMTSWKLNVQFRERVMDVADGYDGFEVITDKGRYSAHYVVVATGFYDHYRPLDVPGEELPKVKHYYDDVHPYIQMKVAIVGGANSACDVALETWSKGAEVTMVVREPALYEKVKYWILPNIKNRIKEGSIKAYFNSEITAIREDEIDIMTTDGPITIANDYVLAMTGYQPDFKFLEHLGIHTQRDKDHIPVHDADTLETNRKGIYIAGVVKGGKLTSKYFIENTRSHGEAIIRNILLKSSLA